MTTRTRRRLTSGLSLLVAVVAVSVLQYYLVNKPVVVDVVAQKFSPALADINSEQTRIVAPVDDANGIVFLVNGGINEIIDLHFDNARLSEPSLERFEHLPQPAPAAIGTIDFIAEDVKRVLNEQAGDSAYPNELSGPNANRGECRTFVKVESAKSGGFPKTLRFRQASNSPVVRDFAMTADAELLVSVITSTRSDDEALGDRWAPGCGRLLRVGDGWQRHNAGYWDIRFVVPANSSVRYTFRSDPAHPSWKGPKDYIQPIEFGAIPLKASGITIESLDGEGKPLAVAPALQARSADAQMLKIKTFSFNDDGSMLDFSGMAWVENNGNAVTESLPQALSRYPLYNSLFGIGIAALAAWFISTFKNLFKRPEEDYVKTDDD